MYPDKAVFESNSPAFNLEAYAQAGLCELVERTVPHSQRLVHWLGREGGHVDRPQQTFLHVLWEGERLRVLIMHWQDGVSPPYRYYIVADSRELAERFHAAVCEWNTPEPDEYILVFDVHGWSKDEALLAAIRNATLDNLVLRGTLKKDILADITAFFAARDTYVEYGVPWKRGILFVGPAGNGKTHAVKALVNGLGRRCLYVKTFGAGGPDQFGIRAVFERARALAPCLLVLEDLDSIITPDNRSYFLNELDGFEGNDGILTLATTNHPERLDPAIINRPSRFDRKYPFDLPAAEERRTYIEQWNASLRPALCLTAAALQRVAEETDGFSFAYLKELFLSATMRWVAAPQPGTMDTVMAEQVEVLREQMASIQELPSDPGYAQQMGRPPPYHGPVRRGLPSHMVQHPPGPQDVPL
jgi:AAA+ superfamily predicted ATPase